MIRFRCKLPRGWVKHDQAAVGAIGSIPEGAEKLSAGLAARHRKQESQGLDGVWREPMVSYGSTPPYCVVAAIQENEEAPLRSDMRSFG